MKRIFISLIIFVLCAAGALTEVLCVANSINSYLGEIKSIDGYVVKNDFKNAAEKCSQLEKSWSETLRTIDAVLIHDYVDEISIALAQMKSYAQSGNTDMYYSCSETAKKSLESVRDSEYFLPENIL
ncbi:MAG: DUF4363 family protein [Oscillospiraceae bacterium]|uniref:DUF4363 family protein n=1 Tax=Ruminococcus sp. JL13D9 TaxID=3233381 RepID=UPI00270C0296|nr:DUF4363 family protein [Oscillospiraceae bacterium]